MSKSRIPTAKEGGATRKTPVATEDVNASIFPKNPSWRFAKADVEHTEWSILDSHDDVVEDPNDPTGTSYLYRFSKSIDRALLEGLRARESTTWGVLLTQNGGRKGGTNSHNILMRDMAKEAQQRAAELDLDVDGLMSMRLNGKHRVFGIMEEHVLNIIWFDRDHKICESKK